MSVYSFCTSLVTYIHNGNNSNEKLKYGFITASDLNGKPEPFLPVSFFSKYFLTGRSTGCIRCISTSGVSVNLVKMTVNAVMALGHFNEINADGTNFYISYVSSLLDFFWFLRAGPTFTVAVDV